MKHMSYFVLGTAVAIALTACNGKTAATPANYTAALNAYYVEHPDCLLSDVRFPYEVGDTADATPSASQMNALAGAQLLEAKKEPAIRITRYTLTPAGQRLAPRFCYGHRSITAIDNSTAPAVANGFTETQIDYSYKIEDVPVWAKTAAVQAAFPKLVHETSGAAHGKATLALSGVGWSVPE